MTNLVNRLKKGYEYIIYPEMMGDISIELLKMAKYDEEENIIVHYSINELSKELGKAFVPIEYLSNPNRVDVEGHPLRFMLIHWSFDKGVTPEGYTDESATVETMKLKGLKDMREGVTFAKDIDYGNLTGYEFGIFGAYEIGDVPKNVSMEVGSD